MSTTRTRAVPRRRWAVLVVLLLFASMVVAVTATATAGSDDVFTLTILHHNDGESDLLGDEEFGGIARFATLAKALKKEARDPDAYAGTRGARDGPRGSVLVSAGDNFLAGPELSASFANGVPYFDAIGLDLIRYDAFIIGNHEFDFGPDILENFVESFDMVRPYNWRLDPPFLSSNLDFSGEPGLQELVDRGRIAKSHVVTKQGVPVGIVGASTENLPFVTSLRNVEVTDLVAAVQAEVDRLTLRGIKIIVLASHLQGLNEDIDVVSQLSGVDIVVAGGGDELLANEGDRLIPGDDERVFGPYPIWAEDAAGKMVPIVTGPGDYQYLGRLVTEFDRYGDLVYVNSQFSGPQRVSGVAPDAVEPNKRIQRRVVDPVAEFVADLAANVIGSSEVALEGRRDPGIRTEETNLGNLMADSLLWQAQQLAADFGQPVPDVGIQNGGGIRNNDLIPAGPITELDTFDIAPFSNFVTIVPDIPRDQFKAILENAVSQVENVSGRFAQIGGFSFGYDPNGTPRDPDDPVTTPGTRIVSVMLDDGTMIVDAGAVVAGDPITIATIDFLVTGGDQYPYDDAPFTKIGVSYQQALFNYITGPLAGLISAADYPEGGEGRITTVP